MTSASPATRRRREDGGFTMVELLIVILLLGVLAAIAMPTMLRQKQRAMDAQMKSSLRAVATYEETYVVDNPRYGTMAELLNDGAKVQPTQGVVLRLLRYAGDGFCLEATHVSSDKAWFWDSKAGGLQPAGSPGCPEMTTGSVGDTLS